MNEYIARRSLEEDALAQYVEKAKILDHLYHRTGELEETIEALDKNIDEAESIGLDDVANALSRNRNKLNFERLEMEEQLHKLEIELAEFEKIRLMTK